MSKSVRFTDGSPSFFLSLSLFHGSLLTVCQNENENLIKQALLVFWNELNEHSNRVYFASFFSLILCLS